MSCHLHKDSINFIVTEMRSHSSSHGHTELFHIQPRVVIVVSLLKYALQNMLCTDSNLFIGVRETGWAISSLSLKLPKMDIPQHNPPSSQKIQILSHYQ